MGPRPRLAESGRVKPHAGERQQHSVAPDGTGSGSKVVTRRSPHRRPGQLSERTNIVEQMAEKRVRYSARSGSSSSENGSGGRDTGGAAGGGGAGAGAGAGAARRPS